MSGELPAKSAADEMHDLDPIALAQNGLRPIGAPYDLTVQFDGDPLRSKLQLLEQSAESQTFGDLTLFPIDDDSHSAHIPLKILHRAGESFHIQA